MENFAALNWLAIISGTIVAFLFGWLWYHQKVFGRKWAEGSGLSPEPPAQFPAFAMGSQVLALFIMAVVIGITATVDALLTAILVILAVASFTLSMDAFSQKSRYATWVDVFYIICAGVLMILMQAIF